MRRADRPNALPAGLAALALVVTPALVGLAAPAVAAPGDPARTRTATADAFRSDGDGTYPPDAAIDGDPGARGADNRGMTTAPPVASTTTLSLSSPVAIFGNPVTARVAVTGGAPSGPVEVLVDGTPVATVPPTVDGTARVRLPADVATGRHAVTAVHTGAPAADPPVLGSTSAAAVLTVTRTLPTVRTDGTDWTVRRGDPKDVHVQVTGVDGVTPTGTVDVWVNGSRKGSATLDPRGAALVTVPKGTRSALVVVTYAGDPTYLAWVAAPHLLVVR